MRRVDHWESRLCDPELVRRLGPDVVGGQAAERTCWMISVARSGKVKSFLAGPPCRSVSALRLRDDGGPRRVRDREAEGRWGCEGLKPHEQSMVDMDSQLWLRTLVLAEVCESYGGGNVESTFTNWPELQTVLEKDLQLRKIAVDQGALGHQRRKPTCLWSNTEEIVAVHGMKDSRDVEPWPRELNEAMSCSKQLAAWAPGLKWKLVNSWTRDSSCC